MLRVMAQVIGVLIMVVGVIISPLPGPGGIPLILLGLVLVLRNARWARKAFVRLRQRWPWLASLTDRLLRRTRPAPAEA